MYECSSEFAGTGNYCYAESYSTLVKSFEYGFSHFDESIKLFCILEL